MSSYFMQHQISLIAFVVALLLIALINLRSLRRLGEWHKCSRFPRVSILIPARNEEHNIGPCVRSLLAQEYPDFEVLVLDDDSKDGTRKVLAALALDDLRLQVLEGKALPADWLGKHWACHQLARAADGELLLFTDADTRHHPHTLREAVTALIAEKADLLSAVPQLEVRSWAERLTVPIVPWSIFCFLPLALAHRLRTPGLSATVGYYMLFRSDVYEQIGGHSGVRLHGVDDLALGRRTKAHGFRCLLVDGQEYIHCRMYQHFRQVYEGFTKNLFAAFEYKVLIFVFVWVWVGMVFVEPLLVAVLGLLMVPMSVLSLTLAVISIAVSVLLWGITHWRFGFPLYLAIFYPLTIILMVIIAMSSMVLTLTGRTTWKGRTLARQRIRRQ